MMSPAAFPRRVLFTVTGLTPQIVTETVYALAVRQTPAFVPTQLLVMTTSDGANRVRLTLQGSEPGWLARLCKDYALPPIGFAADDLRVLRDAGGGALADIRTGADNEAAANAIIETIRTLTADPGCALHVSLAGGRKTLGFFAAYALSLYGRPQDRLSHVLVSPEFESSTDFYYPTPYHQVIYTRDRTPLDTRDAVVELADIPFVRMRDGLPEALRAGQASYGQAVAAVQDRLRPAALVIDLRQGGVTAEPEHGVYSTLHAMITRHKPANGATKYWSRSKSAENGALPYEIAALREAHRKDLRSWNGLARSEGGIAALPRSPDAGLLQGPPAGLHRVRAPASPGQAG
jgi:CRISPR-associated protein (TIGR02584 family)